MSPNAQQTRNRVSATSRTAVYGPVRTVVWEGRSRETPPYPDRDLQQSKHPDGPRISSAPSRPRHSALKTPAYAVRRGPGPDGSSQHAAVSCLKTLFHRKRPKSRKCCDQSGWIVLLHIMPRIGHGNPCTIGESGREARGGLVGEDLASAATNHQAATAQTFGGDGHLFDLGKQRRVVGGSAAVAGMDPLEKFARARRPFEGNAGSYIDGHQT